MKKNYSIIKILSFFILFSIINSCSNDDSNIPLNTFLEFHEGSVWIDSKSFTDEITYIRFINNVNTILEVYNKFIPANRECFNNYYISQFWGEIKIIENTVNKIEFIILPPDWELNTVEFTFIKLNEKLNLAFNVYDEYGNLIEATESILIKSNVNVDQLPIWNYF